MMNKIKGNIIPLSLMLIIPIVNVFYGILNNSNRGVYTLVTDLDKSMPFIPVFSVPYMTWYPFIIICLIYMCFRNRSLYYKSLSAIVISLIISYIIFFFFQTTVPRPEVVGNDIFSSIVKFIYNTDNPYNCFPSIHVITTYIIMRNMLNHEMKNNKMINIFVLILGILIIISTEFIKQHVLFDIIFAIILGEGIYNMINYYGLEMIKKCQQKKYLLLMMKKKSEI
ncbi:phosphatase PAP2 family protein [Clostridium tepidum]|uniref:Inositol phosphorylceramide synthase n=1 Tax=Clostridium tepidum TaxID=1962263 RepID=A0A1S9IHH5_9CLOT|nr:phosphatase PAP2 family protein [Clostridium tepidum]OOO69655.1 inositol phosphorylceramide synthase [Clostridium tepidum]